MIKAVAEKEDGTKAIVFGLSHKNLAALKEDQPILIEMSELGLEGKMVITAVEKGSMPVPKESNVSVLGLTLETIAALKAGQPITLGVQSDVFVGEILIFSGKDESTMGKLFEDYTIGEVKGSTCGKCGSGRRDDGSCDCKETMI